MERELSDDLAACGSQEQADLLAKEVGFHKHKQVAVGSILHINLLRV